MNLDSTDIKILQALRENGRLSYRQIAEKVKVSVPTVSSKVSNLESMGIIKGYSAELDAEKLGGVSHIVEVFCKPSDIVKLGERFRTMETVRRAYQLSSGHLLLVCTFPTHNGFNEFIRAVSEIPELTSYNTSALVTVIKDESRALIRNDGTIILECAYCHKIMHDTGRKVSLGDKDYYVCCPVCEKALEEKYASLQSKVHA
jgi:Lrp/AsnC family leucine-responsive transcriptional regulator